MFIGVDVREGRAQVGGGFKMAPAFIEAVRRRNLLAGCGGELHVPFQTWFSSSLMIDGIGH